MSFPRGTEMFQFPRFAFGTYGFSSKYLHGPSSIPALPRPSLAGRNRKGHGMAKVEGGFPHSEIQGSKPVRGSPRLIAAYHVLHRLSAPRHPPDTLMTLDHSHHRCPPGDTDVRRDGTSTLGTTIVMPQVHPPGGPKTFASKHVRDEGRSGSPSPRCTLRGPSHDGKGDAAGSAHAVRAASASCACLAAGPSGRTHSLFTMSNNTLRPEAGRCAGWTDQRRILFDADGLEAPGRLSLDRSAPTIARGDGGARRDRTDDLMLAKHALYRLSYCPDRPCAAPSAGSAPPDRRRRLVGLGRLELPTSRLSSARSNQLSYKPRRASRRRTGLSAGRKRNEDGGVPPMGP